MKVVIVGGGVIGMLQARALAKEGHDVAIVDKGELGREASWAGGGIVSPLYPWRYNDAVTALAARSQEIYLELVQDLQTESGIDPEFSQHGLLVLSVDDESAAKAWSDKHDSWLEEIDKELLTQLEPALSERFTRSLWMPKVASVRNPRLLNALRKIMHSNERIQVVENNGVEALKGKTLVLSSGDTLEADAIVFCSGAWTSTLLPSLNMDIEPVKGQMIVFDAPKGLVNRVVLSDGRYVIPRQDGKVVAGSTLEYKGFEKTTDAEAKQSLFDSAVALFPELAKCEVIHHWAGLRPGSPKGIPKIGAVPNLEGVYVNAGHFRNGLVLAPASVELLGDLIANRSTNIDANPYALSL